MSFKRAGDDKKQLNVLRKRRITDLLSEDIPDDEATIISNGRLACLVCHHRPVFDTVNMLTVHRHGKKHAACATIFYQQKQELSQLVRQRRLEEISKYGKTNIEELPASGKFLGSATAYDSRVKKLKSTDRKPRLDLTATDTLDATRTDSLPGNRSLSYFTQMISQQAKGPVQHCNNLKKIFQDPHQKCEADVKPYKKIIDRNKAIEEQYNQFSKQKASSSQDFKESKNDSVPCLGKSESSKIICSKKRNRFQNEVSKNDGFKNDSFEQTGNVKNEEKNKNKNAETYLQLRGAGWKKDWAGKWIRDEEAEFDSDEEPPDLP